MGRDRLCLFICLLYALFTGDCRSTPPANREILVGAAISLAEPLEVIAHRYETLDTLSSITFTFAGSGTLAHQIRHGAPVDLYISAAQSFVDTLLRDGYLLPDSPESIASNRLTVIRPRSHEGVKILPDLRTARRIALGDPVTVPAGMYAKQALITMGYWSDIQGRLVYARDVRQVLAYVEQELVDAGFVYASDARLSEEVVVVHHMPDSVLQPVAYVASIVSRSVDAALSRSFLSFLRSDSSQAVFRASGFLPATNIQR